VIAPIADTNAATMVLETPGDTAALALLDTTEIVPVDAVDLETYEDEPPPRRVASAPSRSASTSRRETEPAASEPLPPIASAPPVRAGTETGGRLQITVEQPTRGSSGSGLFEQGLAAQRRGDFETAKNRYLQATYEQPRNLELWNNLGTVYRALRDLSGAEGALRTATEIDRNFAPAWNNLGIVLAQQGRAQEAMTALQEAVRLDPTNSGAKVNLAIQLHASGALADARRLLDEAVRADPAMAEAHYELGRVLEKQNDRAGAIREYRIFLENAGGRFPALEQAVRSRLTALSP
jgi:Flp pilus assembly protein TadD